jgi:hypothetical protein
MQLIGIEQPSAMTGTPLLIPESWVVRSALLLPGIHVPGRRIACYTNYCKLCSTRFNFGRFDEF